MRHSVLLLSLCATAPAWAAIPATPVMTLYQFDGDLGLPYYRGTEISANGLLSPAGTLTQGTRLVPCLVVNEGTALTDGQGTPYVGFAIVLDPNEATPATVENLRAVQEQRRSMRVPNHHCDGRVEYVLDARTLIARDAAPRLEPPLPAPISLMTPAAKASSDSGLDPIVRAFHNSPHCVEANGRLVARRTSLRRAWDAFLAESTDRWPAEDLERAMHLDHTMRTALYEGHLDRGCTAYGACERNIIALSIRNRARGRCRKWQGCQFAGDFAGVATLVSQYNIWDELLAQTSGLTSCFLRHDLTTHAMTARLQAMYAQSVGDVERILYGTDVELQQLFAGTAPRDLHALRHYYHPPAMGKCFPDHQRVEYISAAVANKGGDFALLANTWIHVDDKTDDGYGFRDVVLTQRPTEVEVRVADSYTGFVVDRRKITLRKPSRCTPYGIPPGCRLDGIGRYGKLPFWLASGRALEVACKAEERGPECQDEGSSTLAKVGGRCDKEMRPVAGVP